MKPHRSTRVESTAATVIPMAPGRRVGGTGFQLFSCLRSCSSCTAAFSDEYRRYAAAMPRFVPRVGVDDPVVGGDAGFQS